MLKKINLPYPASKIFKMFVKMSNLCIACTKTKPFILTGLLTKTSDYLVTKRNFRIFKFAFR